MKKVFTKLLSFVAALAMVLGMNVTTAFAADATGSITITPPKGTLSDVTNTYKIYKVFDAKGDGTGENGAVSYTLPKDKSLTSDMAEYFSVDDAGNISFVGTTTEDGGLDEGAINAIRAFVAGETPVATVKTKGEAAQTVDGIPNGYYFVSTTTGTLVNINTSNPNALIQDKNEAPELTKEITGVGDGSVDEAGKQAIAQIGTTVDYTVTVTIKKGSKNTVFHDIMDSRLALVDGSVKVEGVENATVQKTPDAGDTITVKFADGTIGTATITYQAIITKEALVNDAAKNTARVTYGEGNHTIDVQTEVYTGKLTVNKTFQGLQNGETLANGDFAQFVLKNAKGEYYQMAEGKVNWVAGIDDATKVTINANGTGDGYFSGLADGTYTLVESKVPASYNKAVDTNVTILKGEITTANLEKTETIENKLGSALPTTGGVGTTIFYVLGAALVFAAGAVLVIRKRISD